MNDRSDNSQRSHAGTSSRWQFSLLVLLAATTLISICLGLAVHFPVFMAVVIGLGLIQAAVFFTADWLIRTARPRGWALATAAAYVVLGSGFAFVGGSLAYVAGGATGGSNALMGGGFVCYLAAWLRLRLTR